jgi:hypothetical protein
MPPKKAVGNKDVNFIIERRYFLERFLKQISQYSILINSQEFRIFTRPDLTGGHPDVGQQLGKLTKLQPEEIAKRFYDGFGLNDVMFKHIADKQQEYEYILKEFDILLKNLLTQYKALRKQIKGLMEIKGSQIATQRQMVSILHRYEEKSLYFYAD